MEIKRILVVGMGLMGSGIAQVYAQAGYEVFVNDITEELITGGIDKIDKNLSKDVSKGKIDDKRRGEILSRIKIIKNLEEATDIDLVQTAIPEDMDLKRKVHAQLAEMFPPRVIYAVCTSALSISEMAAGSEHPDKIVGTHFHSPAHAMKLVEVIQGLNTSDETIKTITDLLNKLDKLAIKVSDSPGFITGRVWEPMGMAAIHALVEGVGTKEDIDAALEAGFNHPIGPLKLMDIIGLDVMLDTADDLERNFGSAYAAPPLLRRMVAAGQLGVKTGKGFYEYPKKKP